MSTARPSTSTTGAVDAVTVNDPELDKAADTRGPIRLGFWVLVVGFGLFLVWAALAPLDEGVSAPAAVSIETKRATIQHVQGGVIREVRVKEAQTVKAGDVLLVLDDGAAKAGQETVLQAYLAQRAQESRLLAELGNAAAISFHPDLNKAGEGEARQHMVAQTQLFQARRAAQLAEFAAANEAIAGTEAQIGGLRAVLESRRAQAAFQSEQLNNVRQLANEGFAPRNQALQLEQQQAELRAQMSDAQAQIQRLANAIAEQKQKIAQRRQEYVKEVSAQLADVRREVQANQERLSAITAEVGRTEIRSPVDGEVVGLQLAAQGGVVTPGQRIMDIVPRNATLVLDARIPPHVIDRVRVGDPTEVRFSSFANTPQLVVDGRVVTISADALTEQQGLGVVQYYLGRVEVTEEGRKVLGKRQLTPGMPAEVLVRTGERSMLTYLLHPFTKRVAAAMKEE